jgi:TRAP transporter TAXI family solute receptor
MMKKKMLMFLICTLVVIFARVDLSMAASAFSPWPENLKAVRIVSGGVGGSWYPFAARMAYYLTNQLPGIAFSGIAGAATANVQAIHDGDAEISVNDLLPTIQGFRGVEPYEEKMPELRLIGTFQMTNFGAFVRADSDINTFEDMLDKRITTTRTSSDFITITMNILGLTPEAVKAAGGTLNYSTNADCVQLMQDRQADVYFCQGFIGKPDIMSLDETIGLKWVGMTNEQINILLQDEMLGMLGAPVTIPAGSLKGQKEETLTIGAPQVAITSSKMPDELIYYFTKFMLENSKDLGASSGHFPNIKEILIGYQEGVTPPFHEGAMRYYKEIGLMK